MAILGKLLKNGIKLWETIEQDNSVPHELQKAELKKLLINARDTEFGEYYRFKDILKSFKSKESADFYQYYKNAVPLFDYDKIYEEWWYKTRDGQKNICWPGKVKYFAMSSGTSGDSSKYIPVTGDMINAMHRTSIRQILTLSRYDLPSNLYNKGILMLGGSTQLRKMQSFYDGDLSGITASKIPFWFQHFYKPGKKISRNPDWGNKLDEITENAKGWDIGVIVGVPAWLQLLLEKIIAQYKLNNIHEIWPNLKIFVHGGVAFEPYKRSFEKLLGKPLIYIETYLASEGFIAFQAYPERNSMRLVLNNGLFYEFIPFNEKNFDAEGRLVDDAETFMIDEVKEGVEYALLLTTCAGTYRYLIGDVIRFVNIRESEIVITGRTKHFLSLCGEHLSVDNMNQAVKMVSDKLEIEIKEFAAAGIPDGSLFAHKWWIGCDCEVDADTLKTEIDQVLKDINDDYQTERKFALKNVYLDKIPTELFYKWMRIQGKEGAQNKFPRVLRKEKLRQWTDFLKNEL
jgi:hypothetical protein